MRLVSTANACIGFNFKALGGYYSMLIVFILDSAVSYKYNYLLTTLSVSFVTNIAQRNQLKIRPIDRHY